jgi:glycosyltransferase involved in cell wall biosynthesis
MDNKTATPTIALAMIVKNEEANLAQVLSSAKDHVDEIIIVDTGSTDDTKKIALSFGAKVYDFKWVDDFSAARNFSFSKATKDWILWLDADDVLQGGENMKALLSTTPESTGGYMAQYYYGFDEVGNCVAVHQKVRLCRNNKMFSWKGRIHEDLIPVSATSIFGTTDVSVKHTADAKRVHASSERNLTVAKLEYEDKKHDPRVVFNMANAYLALGRYNEAVKHFLEYVPMSGWDEEKYIAWCRVAHCLQMLEQFDEATNMYLRAVKLKPNYAEAYRGLAHCSVFLQKLDDAEEYFKMTLMKEKPDSVIVWNPFEYEVAPYYELAQVYMHQNKVQDALDSLEVYIERSNGKENGLALKEKLLEMKKVSDFREAYIKVANQFDEDDMVPELKSFIDLLPSEFKSDPGIILLRNKRFVKTESTGRDIAIWCGQAWEEWGPNSLKTGIGGSEEAVIRLSREWAKSGYHVTVFNNCGPGAILDVELGHPINGSVTYRPFWEFNPKDKFDVFISWRSPAVFDHQINAPVKLLDLHDVPNIMEYSTKRMREMTKIMLKTNFHRNLLPNVPQDKVVIIGHGVDATEFSRNIPRIRHRVCYTSSYDRGLEHLLDIWPEVIKEVPDAELHIAYGWKLFEKVYSASREKMAWKKSMDDKMAHPSVVEHGRMSHDEVADLMSSSGVFAYPSDFAEIFCIAAAKAQVAGCVPVVAVSANCMKETVKIGVTITGDIKKPEAKSRFKEELVKMLKDEKLQKEVGDKAREVGLKEFDWSNVAKEWEKEFKV